MVSRSRKRNSWRAAISAARRETAHASQDHCTGLHNLTLQPPWRGETESLRQSRAGGCSQGLCFCIDHQLLDWSYRRPARPLCHKAQPQKEVDTGDSVPFPWVTFFHSFKTGMTSLPFTHSGEQSSSYCYLVVLFMTNFFSQLCKLQWQGLPPAILSQPPS